MATFSVTSGDASESFGAASVQSVIGFPPFPLDRATVTVGEAVSTLLVEVSPATVFIPPYRLHRNTVPNLTDFDSGSGSGPSLTFYWL